MKIYIFSSIYIKNPGQSESVYYPKHNLRNQFLQHLIQMIFQFFIQSIFVCELNNLVFKFDARNPSQGSI